jgi:hypothetical protein
MAAAGAAAANDANDAAAAAAPTSTLTALLTAARGAAARGDAAQASEAFAAAVRCAAPPARVHARTQNAPPDFARATHAHASSAYPRSAAARLGLAGALRGDAGDAAALADVEAHLLAALEGAPRRAAELRDARSRLALLYCQEGRDGDAAAHTAALGARYRLARGVLRYPPPPPPADAARCCDVAHAEDGALPASMLAHLRAALAPGAPFWAAHAYHAPATGYFSFVHLLGAPPACAFEQILAAVVARAIAWRPAAARATAVEWWAHCRPHACGHQLHFDSDDEGAGPRGPRHPLVSTVLYLSEGAHARVGGPTLVTPQRRVPDASLADEGWLLHPGDARLGMFDGGVLHGVLPGRGPSPAPGGRRVTLMVALWDAIETRPPPHAGAPPGAARPFPFPTAASGAAPPWAAALAGGAPRAEWAPAAAAAHAAAAATAAPLRRVAPMWEDCDAGANAAAGVALASLPGIPHYGLCFQGF